MKDGKHVDKGRVYRISYGDSVPTKKVKKYDRPYTKWMTDELLVDLQHHALPVRRTNAQNELVSRGVKVRDELIEMLRRDNLPAGATTWLAWTLGQIGIQDTSIDEFLANRLVQEDLKVADRIQAVRVLGQRARFRDSRLPLLYTMRYMTNIHEFGLQLLRQSMSAKMLRMQNCCGR